MSLIHYQSNPATKSELDLFQVPLTQTAIEQSIVVDYRPTSSLSTSSTLEFQIPATDEFTDLNSFELEIIANVTKGSADLETGSGKDDGKVLPLIYLLNTMWQEVTVMLGSTNVTRSTSLYSYKSIIEGCLFESSNAKKSILSSALWLPDDKRKALVNASKPIHMKGHLHLDLFQQDKFLLNGVPMTIRFTKAKPSFLFKRTGLTEEINLNITKAVLSVKKVKLYSDAHLGIAAGLQVGPAKYFIDRRETKSFTIANGSTSASFENVFSGQLPRFMIVGFVDGPAFTGDYTGEAFNFKDYKLNYLVANVGGQMIPSTPYTPDYDHRSYAREYNGLFSTLNQDRGIPMIDLSYEEYKTGNLLYGFKIQADDSNGADSGVVSLLKNGSIRIDAKFGASTTKAINMIVYAAFDSVIQIDKERNVKPDY